MEKKYRAKRHKKRRSYLATMHSFGWGIICFILIAVLISIWSQSQSLRRENNALRQQLASDATIDDTCRVVGSWRADESRKESVSVNGTTRDYLIHMPDKFENGKYYPLMLFYVGRGSNAAGAEVGYDLDRLPAITIYPVPTIGAQNKTAWEGAPYSSGADDIAFTSQILDQVQSDLCIDRTRVYVAGMSNGGGFASLLSCKLPDRFAAYAIVAGAMYPPESTCRPLRPTPIISIHGDRDPTVPYNGSLTRRLPPIESWTALRASYNGCARSTTTYDSATIVLTTWIGCNNNAMIENVRIEGGGHVWGAVPNETLWQFLSQFSL